jgi:hypothetical protein
MLLIGGAHVVAGRLGLELVKIDPTDVRTFLANLSMLQMYPMTKGFGTFGTAGQLSSIAQEFHIYFFVGALYFLCIGRQRVVAAIVAVLSARMPLGNFLDGRALFLLWMMGFSVYFVVRSVKIDGAFAALSRLQQPEFYIRGIRSKTPPMCTILLTSPRSLWSLQSWSSRHNAIDCLRHIP